MSSRSLLNYEPMCNETTVNEVLVLASLSAGKAGQSPNSIRTPTEVNSTMELYTAFSVDDPALMAPGATRDIRNMSFTMIGVNDPGWDFNLGR